MLDLPTTSYAVLGMLSHGPGSRYDLAHFAEQSIANFWTIAKSQVYGELDRLERLGYVKGKEVKQKSLPDKRVFELTTAGRAALREWLSDPSIERERIRSGFLVKLFFAREMPPEVLEQMVGRYRDEARKSILELEKVTRVLKPNPSLRYMRATAEFGLSVQTAIADWADNLLRSVKRTRATGGRK